MFPNVYNAAYIYDGIHILYVNTGWFIDIQIDMVMFHGVLTTCTYVVYEMLGGR